MKAVLLRDFGGADRLSYEDVPDAKPCAGEVLVRVAAVSINRSFDIGVRSGRYSTNIKLPLVLGADPTGTVVACGAGVAFPQVGERVAVMATIACSRCRMCRAGDSASCTHGQTIGVHRWGGYAEYVAVPASNVAVIPDALDFEQANVIARHGSAAHNFLIRRGGLKPGETALILGASGALGGFAVQIAKIAGARVIAAAGSEDRAVGVRRLGADDTIDYSCEDVCEHVRLLTKGEGVDLAFDASSEPELWSKAFAVLSDGGRIVTAGAHAGSKLSIDAVQLYRRRLRVIGAAGTTLSDLDFALAAGGQGKLVATIDSVIPLSEAAHAHRLVEANKARGKILLSPDLG